MAKNGEKLSFTLKNEDGSSSDYGVQDYRNRFGEILNEEELIATMKARPETQKLIGILSNLGIAEADIEVMINDLLAPIEEAPIEEPVEGPVGE